MENSMPELKTKKNKHMTLDERLEIQECLNKGMTFKAIAKRIGRDQTTISKEVKKHLSTAPTTLKTTNPDGSTKNTTCHSLLKAPFVCNPCKHRHSACSFQKRLYHAKVAQKEYESVLVEAREGIPLTKESFYVMDKIIAAGVNKGQHLYHIMKTNDLGVSKSTVYRHLKLGYLSASPFDFPRVLKFKARNQHKGDYIPKALKIGRTYTDFLLHSQENAITSWVEMDTVIGRIGGKVILTLIFTFCNFMVGILLDNKTKQEAAQKITELKHKLASNGYQFGQIFPIILTDNGGEFANVFAFENDSNGSKECSLFFCDPMQSSQKPHVEKNHTLFRDIVPQGNSFDDFTQDTVNLIFSHVNGVKRKSLNGKSPYDVFTFTYSDSIAALLGIDYVPAQSVLQTPKLLKSL
jgi:IS30 family transposase